MALEIPRGRGVSSAAMSERETLEVDVLLVGAGPASLASAYHLTGLVKAHNARPGVTLLSPQIAIIEKGAEVGNLGFSGAVMDPRGLTELMPDWRAQGCPVQADVSEEEVLFLTEGTYVRLPVIPPPMQNHGNVIVSLSELCRWLGRKVEAREVSLFTGFSGRELLYEGDKVVGVRTGDKGLDKHGKPKGNFEPGIDLKAKVTVLGEGPRGTLTKALRAKLSLDEGRNPPAYGTGVKEVWELADDRFEGKVLHTMGFPLSGGTMGGSFLYGMANRRLVVGFVTWLNTADPFCDPHQDLQRLKTHPYVRRILEGAKLLQYGAKAVPEGGYFSIPRLAADGVMLIGDSAEMVNAPRLKGIHLAIKSGMLAAEAAFQALLKGDASEKILRAYPEAFEKSWAREEMWSSRNFHAAFEGPMWLGMARAGAQNFLAGLDPLGGNRLLSSPDHAHARPGPGPRTMAYDGKLTFSKVDDVFHSGTTHEEDQPPHLLIRSADTCLMCLKTFGGSAPCESFCPAAVYEKEKTPGEGWKGPIKLNASNCVHCKTCDIRDPFGNITWVPPEGGGGPKYTIL